ncbi:MAG: hypothetical protein BGP06_21335 [Rhizobiales bacterium 65-9]|nr:hypothetical protein [Hyphomicrobiales bacterium]OJY36550.1 MAG: hypothetical protein BGP06_21335 [Rhizobiales bacterium 65-9]
MTVCFVMQPFDSGAFDDRYEDVLAPAIKGAGLEPYRVDRDPKVSLPIQEIENGIRNSSVCLADISLDNPNVWFELGYAIAAGKEVILICSEARTTKFPFDVQHRTIEKYQTGSPRNFQLLQKRITQRLKAILEKESTISRAADLSLVKKIEGLDQAEIVALATITENLYSTDDAVSMSQVRRDMERAGFTNLATAVSIKTLSTKQLIAPERLQDQDGDYFTAYGLTEAGWEWVVQNKNQFLLRRPAKSYGAMKNVDLDLDDDMPF